MELPISPLQESHEKAGAEFIRYEDVPVVLTFGEPAAEYAAIRKSAAIIDRAQRSVLEVGGADRACFLNNLLTNQTLCGPTKTPMAAGTCVYAFFLNGKGRIVAAINVLELGDRIMLEMDARRVKVVADAFEKYIFRERVELRPRLGELHALMLMGPAATEHVSQELGPRGCGKTRFGDIEVVAFRDDLCGSPGYGLIAGKDELQSLWRHFTSPRGDAGGPEDRRFRGLARPAGWAMFNTARIEAGRPIFGIDYDESALPAETGEVDRAVSFTKGCYLGQEVVARMHARGQVARQIAGIRMEDDSLPIAGSKVYDSHENEVGAITSSTNSPMLSSAAICLAMVKRGVSQVGSAVRVPAEGRMRAGTVTSMPFS